MKEVGEMRKGEVKMILGKRYYSGQKGKLQRLSR